MIAPLGLLTAAVEVEILSFIAKDLRCLDYLRKQISLDGIPRHRVSDYYKASPNAHPTVKTFHTL